MGLDEQDIPMPFASNKTPEQLELLRKAKIAKDFNKAITLLTKVAKKKSKDDANTQAGKQQIRDSIIPDLIAMQSVFVDTPFTAPQAIPTPQ